MGITELQQIAENGNSGNFRQAFDLRNICPIQITDNEEENSNEGDSDYLIIHFAQLGCWVLELVAVLP